MSLPINVDCGENFGYYHLYCDEVIMQYADLVNVACGYHAGDATTMLKCVRQSKGKNVKIGAHPSYPDLQGFGRRNMDMTYDDLYAVVLLQISSLYGICKSEGVVMHHVKAHGALYNKACKSEFEASAIIDAVKALDKDLIILAPHNSAMHKYAENQEMKVMYEAFADRKYLQDLSLKPRKYEDAFFNDEAMIYEQYNNICNGFVITENDNNTPIVSQTVCIHGEHTNIESILKTIKK